MTEQVELKVLPQAEINHGVESGELDIVTTNPTHFLVIRNRYPLTGVIATRMSEVNGQPVQHLAGVIITRTDRLDIRELADVRGKVVATPSTQHMGGYRAQAYELYLAGVRMPDDVRQLLELETHQAVVHAVLDGRAEVGLIREGVLELMQHQGQLHSGQLKLLHPQQHANYPFQVSTRLYPEWPVFALPHVSDKAVRHVAAALFALEPDHPAARAAGAHGYTVSADYLPVEALARALRLPPFDQNLDVTWQDIWQTWRLGLITAAVATLIILALAAVLVWLAKRERQARARLSLLLDTLGEGVYGTDASGHCSFINRAALHMLGRTEAEVLGQSPHLLFHPQRQNGQPYLEAECPMSQTLHDGQVRRGEEWFVHPTQGGFPVGYVVSPIRQGGALIGSVVAFQDIHLRKKIEANLHHLIKELTQTNSQLKDTRNQLLQSEKLAAIGQLAAGVAHEINNPVAFVTSNLGTLASYVRDLLRLGEVASTTPAGQQLATEIDLPYLRQDVTELLTESRDGLERVRKIVLDLRNFSRSGDTQWEDASVNDCLDAALNIIWNELKYKCTLHKHYGELPLIRCNASQLSQVFMNLLLNAAQAIPDQGDITLTTEAVTDPALGRVVRITLSDTGTGIAPENIQRIFDPFFTTKPVGKGTGLGLSLVWGIVEQHQGHIDVASQPGQGTTFTVTLPVATQAPTGATTAPETA